MLEHKVLYTSDIHGNLGQLRALVGYAVQSRPRTVIIAGELAPKNENIFSPRFISSQRKFLETDLTKMIKLLKEHLPTTTVFVTLGNDDCALNEDVLNDHPDLYTPIHGRRVQLDGSHDIVGYSFVPLSRFALKDFEKFDLPFPPETAKQEYEDILRRCSLSGLKSGQDELDWYTFSPEDALRDSIKKDLESDKFTANPAKTLYVFHSPPYGTVLDMICDPSGGRRVHVGSFAVREFIEKHQPPVTLHGHIHESVDLNGGRFTEQIGSTLAMSAGNDNDDPNLAVLVFNLYQPKSVQRVKLPSN